MKNSSFEKWQCCDDKTSGNSKIIKGCFEGFDFFRVMRYGMSWNHFNIKRRWGIDFYIHRWQLEKKILKYSTICLRLTSLIIISITVKHRVGILGRVETPHLLNPQCIYTFDFIKWTRGEYSWNCLQMWDMRICAVWRNYNGIDWLWQHKADGNEIILQIVRVMTASER